MVNIKATITVRVHSPSLLTEDDYEKIEHAFNLRLQAFISELEVELPKACAEEAKIVVKEVE